MNIDELITELRKYHPDYTLCEDNYGTIKDLCFDMFIDRTFNSNGKPVLTLMEERDRLTVQEFIENLSCMEIFNGQSLQITRAIYMDVHHEADVHAISLKFTPIELHNRLLTEIIVL